MHLDTLVDLALEEDIGTGDLTTDLLVNPDTPGHGFVMAKEDLVVAGLSVAKAVFMRLDKNIVFTATVKDGDYVKAGTKILTVDGAFAALLKGERTALNFLQRLSGIATHTKSYTATIADLKTKLTDTRKTTPAWRALEKEAVRLGGGVNHRIGLYDGILIKDNHIKAVGGITTAVKKARAGAHHLVKIEVETTSLDEVREALQCGADIIMLDNMQPEAIKQALKLIDGQALTEISGGINKHNLRQYAELGANFISMGALTHGSTSVDLSMTITT